MLIIPLACLMMPDYNVEDIPGIYVYGTFSDDDSLSSELISVAVHLKYFERPFVLCIACPRHRTVYLVADSDTVYEEMLT